MGEILQILSAVYEVGKWAYTQFNTMKENTAEAQELAGRILRLSGVAHSLKTQLQSESKQLSPNIPAHMKHVEEFFVQLEQMLQAHNPKQTYAGGFLNKCKAVFAKGKVFFGAKSWRDQLVGANNELTQVLGDLEKAIVTEDLMISINISAVVEGIAANISQDHLAILGIQGALQQQHELLLQGTKGISRIEAAQQQQHKELLQRFLQLEHQQEHADESKVQEMMHELHQMMQQQQQMQAHAAETRAHSDVSELKVMIQELQHKLQLRSMARHPSAAAPASQELRGMRTFTTSDITIIERIGEGGNSDVYKAQCRFFPGHIVYKKCYCPQTLNYLLVRPSRRLLQ